MAYPYGTNPYPYSVPYIPPMGATVVPYQSSQQTNQNGIIAAWVQGGEQSMKSYPLGPNQKAFLFSTEENIFGMKSTDANGMPYPLELFRFERISNSPQPPPVPQASPVDTSTFITREEFESRFADLTASLYQNTNNRPQRNNQNTNQNGGEQKHGK